MYIIFLKKGDLMIKYANTIASIFKTAGGTLTFSKGYDKNGENLTIKPMSFNLSWKPVTPAAATATRATRKKGASREGRKREARKGKEGEAGTRA